jgi:hypothetical protein
MTAKERLVALAGNGKMYKRYTFGKTFASVVAAE